MTGRARMLVLGLLAAPLAAQADRGVSAAPTVPAWRGALEAYTSWPSVRAGGTLGLHVSSREPRYDIEVHRQGETAPRWERRGLPGTERAAPAEAPAVDCLWPVDCELPIGADWPSGTWWVRLSSPTAPDVSCEVPFTVRPATPGARILALAPACTVAAYETWGGACLYPSIYGPPSPVVTLHRPHDASRMAGLLWHGDPAFEAWLAARGLHADHAADADLQREPDLLDAYDLLLLVGHHEYWSASMRASLDAFVGNGGRLAVLGANTCYWQIRFEQDGTALRCHKHPERDALWDSGVAADRERITSTWLGEPVLQPQERSLGLSWQHASWTAPLGPEHDSITWSIGVGPGSFPSADGFGCWRIATPGAPDLAGLGLARGALLGAALLDTGTGGVPVGLCGGEVDGALTEELDGLRPASSALGAPRNLLVLADAPAQEGFAAIAAFERGGEVLWCSSERFTRGLTEARLAAPDLSLLVESALRRLARPRRNLLANGGFELWDDGAPRGWSATGAVRRAGSGHAVGGLQALEVPVGEAGAVRQAVPALRGDSGHLLLAIARTASADPVLALVGAEGAVLAATHPVSADGLVHAAFAAATGADGAGAVLSDVAADAGVVLDQVELLDEHALRREALLLSRAADGVRLLAAPTPGGGRHLVVVTDARVAEVVLLDADTGRRLARTTRAPGAQGPLLLAGDDEARGGMAHLALELRDAEGRPLPVLDDPRQGALEAGLAWLLPLRLPAPAPSPRLANGGFERADGAGSPGDWLVSGAAAASVLAEARLVGRAGLRLQATADGATLRQAVAAPSGGSPLVLSAFVRGTGELTLALEGDGVTLASRTLTAGPTWGAARIEALAPVAAPTGPSELAVVVHIAGGARLDLDALALRTGRELLVDDLYPNGGFELAPSPAEIARGADWSARLPRWSALPGPPPRLDETHAHGGRRSLHLPPGATAVTHLGWPVAWDRPALVGAHVRTDGPDAVTLRLLVGPSGLQAPLEVARWTSSVTGAWEGALLSVASAGTEGAPPEAYLVIEAGAGGAWLDDLTFVVEE